MKIEHSTEIEATPETVWDVTVDVERWPSWTPTVDSVRRLDDGPFRLGSTAVLKQPGLPEAPWTVTAMYEGVSFTWETRVRGIRMVATHKLEPLESSTISRLTVELTGLPVALFGVFLKGSVRTALEQENAGLKQECEN